jgi:hypothetical protein
MLNMLSNVEAAAYARAELGAGGSLSAGAGFATAGGTGTAILARPRALWADRFFGQGVNVRPDQLLAQASAIKPNASKEYVHTTRIVALSGGTLGPHPARDPV